MNDLVKSIIFADDVITVASLHQNSGAGGVFLAQSATINPHYKTLGLSGGEYHTYTLANRVGKGMAKKLLDECLPISTSYTKNIGMINEVFSDENYFKKLRDFNKYFIEDEDIYDDFLYSKQDYLEENKEIIEKAREEEKKIMYPEFWDIKSQFHKLRYDFIYKSCRLKTPKRLKYNA